jgi:uncharacterized coiled-coil protein SlyX
VAWHVKNLRRYLKPYLALSLCCVAPYASAISTQQQLIKLQQIVKKQQIVLEQQAAEIKQLSSGLNRLTHQSTSRTVIKTKPPIHAKSNAHVRFITIAPSQLSILEQAKNNSGTQPTVVVGNNKAQLLLYGDISPLFFTASDGKDTNAFFATNSPTKSQLNIDTLFHPTKNWQIGSNLALDYFLNLSNVVSQTNKVPPQSVYIDKAEVFVHSKRLGVLFLGKGDTASANTAYSDFSGTALVSRATTADIGGGLFFRNKSTDTLSSITVGDAINGLDGLPGSMRIRYDTPSFGGFILAASAIQNDQQDIALKFGHTIGSAKFAAQMAYTTKQEINTGTAVPPVYGDELNGSASILFPVGISLTGAYGELLKSESGRKAPHYFYIKPGYKANFSHVGATAMSIDMGRYDDFVENYDYSTAYGVQILQNINPWNLIMYMGYRNFSLHGPGLSLSNLNLFIVGALYKF